MEKNRELETTTMFINNLSLELKDVKAARVRLQEELERKRLLIKQVCCYFLFRQEYLFLYFWKFLTTQGNLRAYICSSRFFFSSKDHSF